MFFGVVIRGLICLVVLLGLTLWVYILAFRFPLCTFPLGGLSSEYEELDHHFESQALLLEHGVTLRRGMSPPTGSMLLTSIEGALGASIALDRSSYELHDLHPIKPGSTMTVIAYIVNCEARHS